jgi:hypothetical protein
MATQTFLPVQAVHDDLKQPITSHIETSLQSNLGTVHIAAPKKQCKNVKTQALVVNEPKADFKLETVYLDEVRGDEILIDMKYSGICHTVCYFDPPHHTIN